MSEVTFALGLPHTPWNPERVKSFARLCRSVGLEVGHTATAEFAGVARRDCPAVDFRFFADKEPNRVWAQKLWRWAASTSATHLIQLQDDCEPSPEFWARLHAMVSANPNVIIGLEAAHPNGPDLNARGDRWYVTNSWLVGVGYVFPMGLLREFLAWCDANPEQVSQHNEDELINVWVSSANGPKQCWHPIPTLIDHDTSIPSTYDNDTHAHRRPTVTWRDGSWSDEQLKSPEFWRPQARVKVLPVPYAKLDDLTARRKRKAAYHARFATEKPSASICVAMVDKGVVVPACMMSIINLVSAVELDPCLIEISDVRMWEADVVRVRNRIVQYFLDQTEDTHLLFVDSDVEFHPNAVLGMLRANKPMVACPYPRRSGVNWDAVKQGAELGAEPLESVAYQYSILGYDVNTASIDEETYTTEVEGVGFGLVLLRREELKAAYDATMVYETYADDPWHLRPTRAPIADMFMLRRAEGLPSEDFSFCANWRQLGNKVHLYLGPGAPASHWGLARHGGHIEALGLKRETK